MHPHSQKVWPVREEYVCEQDFRAHARQLPLHRDAPRLHPARAAEERGEGDDREQPQPERQLPASSLHCPCLQLPGIGGGIL